jgi:hypothetical protein
VSVRRNISEQNYSTLNYAALNCTVLNYRKEVNKAKLSKSETKSESTNECKDETDTVAEGILLYYMPLYLYFMSFLLIY